MAESFDPYQSWLSLNLGGREPNHYELLALESFESDKAKINESADRAANLVTSQATAAQVPQSQKLLYQISTARVCLLNAAEKARYDDQLRQQQSQLQTEMPVAQAPPPAQSARPQEMQVPAAPPPAAATPPHMVQGTAPSPMQPNTPYPAQMPGPASYPAAAPMQAPSPAATLVGSVARPVPSGTAPVVARVKPDEEDRIGNILTQSRRIRTRKKMSLETLLVISALCVIAAGIGIYAIYRLTKDSGKPTSSTKKVESTNNQQKPGKPTKVKPAKVANDRPKVSRDTWVDASASPVQADAAKVSVIRAFAGPLPGVPGATDYLFIQIRVRNLDPNQVLDIERWERWAGASFRHRAVAMDQFENIFQQANPFDRTLTTGKITLAPNQSADQFLVFERPPASVKKIRLALSGKAVGTHRTLRLEIPSSMIATATPSLIAWLYSTLPSDARPNNAQSNVTPLAPSPAAISPTGYPIEAAIGVRPQQPK
jgi:hypothetical protein